MNKKHITLKYSMGGAFTIIVLLTTLLLSLSTYFSLQSFIRSELKERIKTAVNVASLNIDPKKHELVRIKGDETSENYLSLKKALQNIRMRVADARYVYTFRKQNDGKIVFVIDAEESEQDMSHVGDVYEEKSVSLMKSFTKPYQVQVEENFWTDKWGTWQSAFAPILNADGTLEGIVGIDISASSILKYERKYILFVFGISSIIFMIVIFAGLYFSRIMSKPLLKLAHEMEKIKVLELTSQTQSYSFIKEVHQMQTALDNMKKGLRSFRKYVPADLVSELIVLEKEALLGAEDREMTILFSDIAGFTSISEILGTHKLIEILGHYFSTVTEAILLNNGSVDKFIGDAVMAFWGAPKPEINHAYNACLGALEVKKRVNCLNIKLSQMGLPIFETRIGLNTDHVMVGNIGFSERMSYTVLGDGVNLASRLEGLNKFYQTQILISESTKESAGEKFVFRLVGQIVVHGKKEVTKVYELVALVVDLLEEELDFYKKFNCAMNLFFEKQWVEAEIIFTDLKNLTPDDYLVNLMLEKIQKCFTLGAIADWSAVEVFNVK